MFTVQLFAAHNSFQTITDSRRLFSFTQSQEHEQSQNILTQPRTTFEVLAGVSSFRHLLKILSQTFTIKSHKT